MLYCVIGLMSGSSLDGLDIAYVELEELGGKWSYTIPYADCIGYDGEWAQRLRQAADLQVAPFMALHAEYGHLTGKLVNAFIDKNELAYKVAMVSSHGHTVFHHPGKYTVQIGDGAAIAAETGLPVVSDLRAMDVALGGQGAPIVPMGEKLLFPDTHFFLNIGGIANISLNSGSTFDAFDVCPANRVLNMVAEKIGLPFDKDGLIAAEGRMVESLLEELNGLEYYKRDFPKSLDNSFGTGTVLGMIESSGLSVPDALATYVEHIALQVTEAVSALVIKRNIQAAGQRIMITGGGALNVFLRDRIAAHLAPLGISVDVPDSMTVKYKEALVMALLGVLRWREEDTVMASVTGASRSSIGGALWLGSH